LPAIGGFDAAPQSQIHAIAPCGRFVVA